MAETAWRVRDPTKPRTSRQPLRGPSNGKRWGGKEGLRGTWMPCLPTTSNPVQIFDSSIPGRTSPFAARGFLVQRPGHGRRNTRRLQRSKPLAYHVFFSDFLWLRAFNAIKSKQRDTASSAPSAVLTIAFSCQNNTPPGPGFSSARSSYPSPASPRTSAGGCFLDLAEDLSHLIHESSRPVLVM
jgi:hypothetical protein